MDSLILLDKIRKISMLVHGSSVNLAIDTQKLCAEISSVLECDIYVLDYMGRLVAHNIREGSYEIKEIGNAESLNSLFNNFIITQSPPSQVK